MARRKLEIDRNHAVKLPNGRVFRMTLIRHPGAVIIIPFLNKDTVVMMRQFRPALKKYIYELPAGTLDPKEKIMTCARRELLEETGLSASKLTPLGSIYPVPGYSTEIIHVFKAEQEFPIPSKSLGVFLKGLRAQPEEYEVIEVIPMTKFKVRQLFKSGKLMDAKSICAFAFCGWL